MQIVCVSHVQEDVLLVRIVDAHQVSPVHRVHVQTCLVEPAKRGQSRAGSFLGFKGRCSALQTEGASLHMQVTVTLER